jgi:hypothetical protein
MIVFVTTQEHSYTHNAVTKELPGVVRRMSYQALLGKARVPRAVYVFTDMDRLAPAALAQASTLFGQLRTAGVRVLNDPARIRSRWGLLRALHDQGINRANAYRFDENVRPRRWPVFIGVEGDHRFPITELLHSWEEVERAAETAMQKGRPRSALIVAEYNAEPLRPGIFRKLSVFRVGSRYLAHTCVHQDRWIAKYGTPGLATPDLHAEELRIVRDNPYRAALEPAFALAGIEYGRADFGVVDGKVHVYEINTNPEVKFTNPKSPQERAKSYAVFRQNYLDALRALEA